jgi:hypothetical protein
MLMLRLSDELEFQIPDIQDLSFRGAVAIQGIVNGELVRRLEDGCWWRWTQLR